MACKRSMSLTYLSSLVAMAAVPVLLLGYLWVSDQYRQFEEQSRAWRAFYMESRMQSLRREVFNAISYIEFERSELEQRQRTLLKERTDNAIAQLDSLSRQTPGQT